MGRKHSYSTRANKIVFVKTPGRRLLIHHRTKKSSHPICPLSKKCLNGSISIKSSGRKISKVSKKSYHRAYGGVLSQRALRGRILRAFFCELNKIIEAHKRKKLTA